MRSLWNGLLKGWIVLTVLALLASLALPIDGGPIPWAVATLLFLWSILGLGVVAALWPYQADAYLWQRFSQRLAVQFTWLGVGRWLAGICFFVSALTLYVLYQGRASDLATMRRSLLGLSGLYGLLFVLYHGGRLVRRHLFPTNNTQDDETPTSSP